MHPQYPRPAASLVKGRWHGEAVTEGFRPPESCPKNGIPQSASLTASPIPFVPLGHFPLIRGIGLSQGGQGTGVTDFFHRGDRCGDDRFNDMGNELDIYGVQ